MLITHLALQSCNGCQNHCRNCAHRAMMDDDPGYRMPVTEVVALIEHCQRVGCRMRDFSFAGPGEPLIWDGFNESVRLVARSGIADIIQVTTNGLALNRITDDVWGLLSFVQVSQYGYPLDAAILANHADKIRLLSREWFRRVDPDRIPVAMRTGCCCPGAMYAKGRIFPHCGATIFEAARRAGLDPWAFSIPLAEWIPDKPPWMKLPCGWCWGNKSVPTINEPWQRATA